jgi:hypothetical protein
LSILQCRFEAQIRNFEHKALQSRLYALSEQFAIPKEKLVTRTKVTFLGTMNFADLWAWTAEHLRDPASTPVFEQTESQTAHLSGFSSPSLLCGDISFVEVVRSFCFAGAWRS